MLKKVQGAERVEFSPKARRNLKTIIDLGLEELAVCIAKNQKSLSDNPALLGRPTGFTLTVREIEIATGAGFLIPITGDMMRMPGVPAHPASENITVNLEGNISGLV
ncbi:Formate-tetrahydrofolate ligase [Salegentibacter salinarum]|nr:Formate-tetrahydrofolate ligase [Salegentibacter salinarum]